MSAPKPRVPAPKLDDGSLEPRDAGVVTLEFSLPAGEARRLWRLPVMMAGRQGPMRRGAADMLWQDTAEGLLAARGCLVETTRRDGQHLVSLAPTSDAAWHPGQVLAPCGLWPAEAKPEEADEPLVGVAALTGQRRHQRLAINGAVVELTLLTGHLRAIAAEAPISRLYLTGPLAGVLSLARDMAGKLPLLPPTTSLAEAARCLAKGEQPPARRSGAPDTAQAASVEASFTLALGHLLEVALFQANLIRADREAEGVHQMRVALRRLRSVLRVFRPLTDGPRARALDARLREVLTLLGPARDWDVFLEGVGADMARLLPKDARMMGLLRTARAARDTAYEQLIKGLEGPSWRLCVLDGIAFLLERPWRQDADPPIHARLDDAPHGFARQVLEKRWQGLLRAGADIAALAPEALHELRLDAKKLRYAAEVLAPVFARKAARRFQRRLAALQQELGQANDAAVASALAQSLKRGPDSGRAWAIGVIEGWCMARFGADRERVAAAWESLIEKESFWSED